MKRKIYDFVKINLLYMEEDVITASAGDFDSDQGNDVTGDDIFD